ncbi:MAG: relaxase/mobilization nuclease domain-containing protein [Hyphomicrobium sp.]
MLAKVVPPTNDFHALAHYLVHGKSGKPSPDRVAWVFGHNLPDADPTHAAKLMTATAQLSARTQNAAYHMMISWGERERPTPEAMQDIARQTLTLAGLDEHQALVMGHGDTPHRHLHMLINRVHPTTGKAWATSHDYARLDAIMRQLADVYGFEYAPGHARNPERTASLERGPNSRAKRAAMRGADTARPYLSQNAADQLGADLSENLDTASTWDDLEAALEARNMKLHAKGKGHVVAGAGAAGLHLVKLSALGLTATAKGPVAKLRQTEPPSRPWVDGVDIVRAMITLGAADRDDLKRAIADQSASRIARKPLAARLDAELATALTTTLTPAKPPKRAPRRKVAARRKPSVDGR